MGHAHDPVVEKKMEIITSFKSYISGFQMIVAILAFGMVSINCVLNIFHLYMLFFGGGHH